MLVIIFRTLVNGDPTSGWSSMVCIVLFVGGLQLLCLGIIGKYIGKIFLETKKRPIYIVKESEKILKITKKQRKILCFLLCIKSVNRLFRKTTFLHKNTLTLPIFILMKQLCSRGCKK